MNSKTSFYLLILLCFCFSLTSCGLFKGNKLIESNKLINCESTSKDYMFVKDDDHVIFVKDSGVYEINLETKECILKKPYKYAKPVYQLNKNQLLINNSIVYDINSNTDREIDLIDGGKNFLFGKNEMFFISDHKVQVLNFKTYKVQTIITLSEPETRKINEYGDIYKNDREIFKYTKQGHFKDGRLFLIVEKPLPLSYQEEHSEKDLRREKLYDFYLLDPTTKKINKIYNNENYDTPDTIIFGLYTLDKSNSVFIMQKQNDEIIYKLFNLNNNSFKTFTPPEVLNDFHYYYDTDTENFSHKPIKLPDDTILLISNHCVNLYNPITNKLLVNIKDEDIGFPLLIRLDDGTILLLNDYSPSLKSYLFDPKQKKVTAIKNFKIDKENGIGELGELGGLEHPNIIKLNNGNILLTWNHFWNDHLKNCKDIIMYDYKKREFYKAPNMVLKRYKATNIVLNNNKVLFYAGKTVFITDETDSSNRREEEAPQKPEVYDAGNIGQ